MIIDGTLSEGVTSKDIILRLVGDLGAGGAAYRALGFSGSTVEFTAVTNRIAVANIVIEAGAKCVPFAPDEEAETYCGIKLDRY